MPPVNTSASPTDVDNEATAELPVLDVAAYESSLAEQPTDTWMIPKPAVAPPAVTLPTATAPTVNAADATAEMPKPVVEAIPTLQPVVPAYDLDHSGTHEMPALPSAESKPRVSVKPVAVPAVITSTPSTPRTAAYVAVPVTLPPSPPLIEELRNALASAERRIEELNERARIADAERTVAVARVNAENAQVREQLARHLESLHTANERLAVQSSEQPQLEEQLFARANRIVELERSLAVQANVIEGKLSLLAKSEQRCEALDVNAMNLRAAVTRRDSQIATLEADLTARQQREAKLTTRLSDALASTDPYVPRLRGEVNERDEQIRLLRMEVDLARTQVSEKDHDLQVAEESIRNLEIEVRDKTGKLEEANVTVEEWRAVIAESQRSILQRDSRIQQLETDLEKRIAVVVDPASHSGDEVALEGPARVLIRTDGNTEFVHVLGRRTRIGRSADNELVLDTKHISRFHAVLLAGPVHTSIEDLNSTNGVFVNGKRIARQVLKDGDRVTVGRTQFRYTVRD